MTVEENNLMEKLIKIQSNNFLLEKNENYFTLALEMMKNIGSINPTLRDELIYGILYHWITENRLNFEQLRELLNISLGNSHLFYKIGENHEDSVFKRSFSVLIVALIIYEFRKDNFLSEEMLKEVKTKIIEYMLQERDLRGYVEEKGWAHSAAHTADALDELAQCSYINKNDLINILNCLKAKVCIGYYVYIDEESERMVTVVESILNRKILRDSEIIHWLQGFMGDKNQSSYIDSYHLKVNIKGFLRSLYFRMLEKESSKFINEKIIKVLKEL
ncbi:DUF2785 domain-containing protein [Clostridium sp.]|uniref:DUF2785 domain-containing protein n=1 Tax=Clostridium sp. TaxID=1506 RepID=UPI002FCB7094